ncbi:MAG: PPOX class F420-dependent oxidoreductase [Actinomycetota bacterium]|nr:PPOX class F420-dependent oxidoreductase [Actinomycetota bacterium]
MLDAAVRELASQKSFAALTTLMPDGQPQTHIMWVDATDDQLLVNTEVGRQKFRNVTRDPRVTVTIFDPQNPYHYAEVRGRVTSTVTGDEARRHLDVLSQKYQGTPYGQPIGSERVILRISPERQVTH